MRKDCFAFKKGECTALRRNGCDECLFYKTKDQIEYEQVKTIKRLKSLRMFEYAKGKYNF